ncbi:thioredoxin family protein [Paenibacillus sp. FJAT-26967]|uniref:thioredoxin family protein n=1 Tax=Paenibacillus sp. FJAT-26967 TaxID=1729690 RepID=UPI000A6B97A4|nr:thioredoxin family protein [Paenibacillus sp. FJAT-26967]
MKEPIMQEWNEQTIQRAVSEHRSFAVFFHTPLCGTCKVARRMLEVLIQMEPAIPLKACNANYMPGFVQEWQISSVPCIVVIERGRVVRTLYAMNSVEYLLSELRVLT